MSLQEELKRLVAANQPIIYIDTDVESSVDPVIREVMKSRTGYEWGYAHRFCDYNTKQPHGQDDALAVAQQFVDNPFLQKDSFLVLKDVEEIIKDLKFIAYLKAIFSKSNKETGFIVFIIASSISIPEGIKPYVKTIMPNLPSLQIIESIINHFAQDQEIDPLDDNILKRYAYACMGLTEFQIQNALQLCYADEGKLSSDGIKEIQNIKTEIIKKTGLLELVNTTVKLEDVGGFTNFKKWLIRAKKILDGAEKTKRLQADGVAIFGLPGCGKTLTAQMIASYFEIPLLRLSLGGIMGKYVGESEQNMNKCLSLAKAISPCVLWVDEVEKDFSGVDGSGNEVTMRLFGTFLKWLAEKQGMPFVVLTGNRIDGIPPELLRPGRFDRRFYVDLPQLNEREQIFKIHIKQLNGTDIDTLNYHELGMESEGFSGSEIVNVLREAFRNQYCDNYQESPKYYIMAEIRKAKEQSQLKASEYNELREEYKKKGFELV